MSLHIQHSLFTHSRAWSNFQGKNMHIICPASPGEEFWQLQRISCRKEKIIS